MEIKNQINIYHQGYKNKEQNPSSNPSFGQLNLQEYPKLAAAAITAAATGLMAVNMNKVKNNNNENLSFQNDLKKAIMIKPLDPKMSALDWRNGAYSNVDDDLIKCIQEAEQKGISEDIIFDNMQQLHNKISNSEIESIANSFSEDGLDEHVQLNVWFNLNDRKQLLQDLSSLRIQIPRAQNETIADYIKRLIEIREDNIAKTEEARHKEVMSKIEYEDEFKPTFEEKIKLTNEEIEDAKKSLARDGVRLKDENSKEELSEHIIDNWVGGGGQYRFEDRAFQYAFQDLDNWASTDEKGNYTREPVYRWISLYRNRGGRYDLFKMVREEMNPGQIYDADRIQSCSKNPTHAENEFGDFNSNKNLKLIIHPKSNISRAKDIGFRKYGGQEVVYMKGEKFKILDKRIVKCREPLVIYDPDKKEYEKHIQTIFRYVIEMQEV